MKNFRRVRSLADWTKRSGVWTSEPLSSIRKIAGWTAATLGDKIGVTKQTISNLENQKSPMTFTQYIAIRAVLDAEVEKK